ncbi:MAG: methylmalonyl Co-A mutase-associated GTPase MeaB, partial [Gemmatimonadetes bacterium]|nr:methylmalonyl Co-A mutase-associated GTPase MeaB [Gemmatimonadota bacterium]
HSGDRRSLARLISMVENADPRAESCLAELYGRTGRAFRIGITGPPGAGKSTLIDALVRELRSQDQSVGVVAVDPTSPFTGGALLGDRVRVSSREPDPGFFFRSMATRGNIGGLAAAASEVSDVFDAYGMDLVLLETVGVGQIELDVVASAECTVVVLVPESGDDVQAMKAGLMEIGDVYVLNKSDRDGSGLAAREIRAALSLRQSVEGSWSPPLVQTVASERKGIDELLDAVGSFRKHQEETGGAQIRKRNVLRERIRVAAERTLRRRLWEHAGSDALDEAVAAVMDDNRNPYELAAELARRFIDGGKS